MSESRHQPRQLGHRPVLDGLRGIAVLLVMLTHTGLLLNGYVGVDLFFGLSGFLITTLLYEEWERTGSISLTRFYERRARRLLPALLLLVAALLVIDAFCWRLTGWSLGKKALTTLLFMNNWVAGLGNAHFLTVLTPTWSLAQEEQFYLIWPLALALLLRRRVPPAAVLGLLSTAVAGSLLLSPYLAAHVPRYSPYFSPIDRGAELLAGCACAIVWRSRLLPDPTRWRWLSDGARERLRGWVRPLRRTLAWALALAFACLLVLQLPASRQVYLSACGLGLSLMLVLIGAERSVLARIVGCRPLRGLGRISYALYLFHLTVRNAVYHYLPHVPLLLSAAITIVASLVLAAASWRLVEMKVLARGRSRSRREQQARERPGPRARAPLRLAPLPLGPATARLRR